MTFATVSVNREQLALLSQWLIKVFPGSTIHQSRDPKRTIQHLSSEKVDAVFADADTCSDWIHIFKGHKSNPSVYLLCHQDTGSPEETDSIQGIVTYPITKQKIQIAMQTVPREIREVV